MQIKKQIGRTLRVPFKAPEELAYPITERGRAGAGNGDEHTQTARCCAGWS
jgi:hypothetical protein